MINGILTAELNAAAKPAMTLEKAMVVFDQLADMEDIAFGYARGGCHARAHIMCRRLLDQGIVPKKAWAFEKLHRLNVPFTSSLTGKIFEVNWWYHTAPALNVEMPDKTVQCMVMDPSLFDGPTSIAEWQNIMGAMPEQFQLLDLGVTPPGCLGSYNPGMESSISAADRDAKITMKVNRGMQEKGLRKVFPSESRKELFQEQPGKFQGKTWVTVPFSGDVKAFLQRRAAAPPQTGMGMSP